MIPLIVFELIGVFRCQQINSCKGTPHFWGMIVKHTMRKNSIIIYVFRHPVWAPQLVFDKTIAKFTFKSCQIGFIQQKVKDALRELVWSKTRRNFPSSMATKALKFLVAVLVLLIILPDSLSLINGIGQGKRWQGSRLRKAERNFRVSWVVIENCLPFFAVGYMVSH